jgi:DNA-binding MarR family transcriptional regulator
MQSSPEAWYADHASTRVAAIRSEADAHTFALAYNLLQLTQLIVNDLEARVHRPRGLTLPGFRLLFKLWLLGPTQPARLADISELSRAAVSNLVNTLERDGFVERDRSGTDRRTVLVDVTEKGRTLVAEAFELQLQREREWFAALDADQRATLAATLRTLITSRPTP